MVLTKFSPLFEIPSLKTLEKEIQNDFGKEGIERIKKSELKLKTSLLPFPKIDWSKATVVIKYEEGEICGRYYELYAINEIKGYFVKNVDAIKTHKMYWTEIGNESYLTRIDFKTKRGLIRIAFHHI